MKRRLAIFKKLLRGVRDCFPLNIGGFPISAPPPAGSTHWSPGREQKSAGVRPKTVTL